MVVTAAVSAASHRDHPPRVGHLVVNLTKMEIYFCKQYLDDSFCGIRIQVGKMLYFHGLHSGYVRKYLNVKNRTFLQNFMRDFDDLYMKFLYSNLNRNNRCENRTLCLQNMRVCLI